MRQTIEYERLKTSLSFEPLFLQLLSNEQRDVCGVLSHLLYLRAQSTMSKGATHTHTPTYTHKLVTYNCFHLEKIFSFDY